MEQLWEVLAPWWSGWWGVCHSSSLGLTGDRCLVFKDTGMCVEKVRSFM